MQLRRLVRLVLAVALGTFALGQAAVVVAETPALVLPDLTMLPPSDVRIEFGAGRKLLRFSTVAVNIGKGPFQVMGYDPIDGKATQTDVLNVRQQIKRTDGSWIDRATNAKMMWAGDGHNHWHILGYQSFRLQVAGVFTLKLAAKTGFCAFDSYVYTSRKPGSYGWEKTCNTRPDGQVLMGTSVNWGDVYRSSISFQWFDITGLPNGDYTLRVIADPAGAGAPDGFFKESNETNNGAWVTIRIGASSVKVLASSARP